MKFGDKDYLEVMAYLKQTTAWANSPEGRNRLENELKNIEDRGAKASASMIPTYKLMSTPFDI